MTPRQRVYAALQRKPTDRVPIWMWYHPAVYDLLRTRFGWDAQTADSVLGNDIRSVHISINREMFRNLSPGEQYVDEWGVTWVREGWYNQVCRNPLASLDASALYDYRFPDADDSGFLAPLESICSEFGDEYFIGADVSGAIFEPCCHIRSMDRLMVDMLTDKAAVAAFFDRAAEFTTRLCMRALDCRVDWIWLGDDVGGQDAMMVSPALWRELLKPRLSSIVAAVKTARPGICGAIRPIIGDLVEIGIDVLNPIQPLCPGMNPLGLKSDFGDSIALFGGLDTQQLLISASADEVYQHTQKLISAMSESGGYLLGASHTIQPDTPIENILAVSRAAGVELGLP